MSRTNTRVKNVLLVTVDSWRADHFDDRRGLGFGELTDSTISFNKAYATGPGTTPSFPALLTGTYPLSFGGLGPLNQDRPKIGKLLQQRGLETAAFQCNPFLSNHFNYDVGYDEFRDYQNPLMGIATKVFPRGIEINNPKLRKVDDKIHLTDGIKRIYQLVRGKPRPYVSAEVIADDTIDWLSTQDSPFFCWSHYMDVHHPCFPPEEYRVRAGVGDVSQTQVSNWYSDLLQNPEILTEEEIESLRQLYDASIDYTCDQVDRILRSLKDTGNYEDTLVIITSDHGELFAEYGEYGKPERMYDELLRVPLIIDNGPGYLNEVTDDLISLLDIPPLIHDAFEFDVPTVYEGKIPSKDSPRKYVMAEHEVDGDIIVGARSSEWLYEGDEINNEHRLFDIRDGRFEQVDKDQSEGAIVREAVLNRLDELDIDAKYLKNEMEDDVEDRLEDLGYL